MTYKRSVKRHAVVQPLDQSIRYIPLTQGQTATVDATDYEHLSQWNWTAQWHYVTKSFYARRWEIGTKKRVWMHHEVLGTRLSVDHKNHDTLDYRRENLRVADRSQNGGNRRLSKNNSSGYKGVAWHTQHAKYSASIRFSYHKKHLGYFITPEEAALAYNQAATSLFGEFACLNMVAGRKPTDETKKEIQ